MHRKKLIFKNDEIIIKKKMNIEYIISAVRNPDWEQKLKQISHEESVEFINQTDKATMDLAFEEENENSLFIFAIGAIYVKAKSTKCFPLYLAELIYKHIFQSGQGYQLFLEILNQQFGESKNNIARFIWGLCNHISNADIASFLKQRNSSVIIVLYWLKMFCHSTKHIFHIMERIQKKSDNYEDIINFLISKKSELLFHSTNGFFANPEKKSFFNFSLLFEIDWHFTFGELEQIRNFLRSHPINVSFLLNCSINFSKNFIGNILNLSNCLDENYNLKKDSLIIPYNVGQIHEFVYFGHYELEHIFQNNQFVFDNLLVPERYNISDVYIFFYKLFLRRFFAFSRLTTALRTYGEKLSEEDIAKIPNLIQNMESSSLRGNFKVWLALMCISRTETISVIQDYIIVLKALFTPRIFGHATSISPFSPSTIYEVIDNIRKTLPDFILNTEFLIVRWSIDENYFSKSLLPVLQLEEKSISIDNSIRSRINYLNYPLPYIADDCKVLLFPCKLQLLMLSRTKDELFSNLKDVLEHIGEESIKASSNDLEEMFFIMENIFKRLKISMDDFYNIYELLPKHPSNDISEAFINDSRFSYLLTNFLEELKVKQLEHKCKEHLATMEDDSKITDAQSELGIILMNCSVCMVNNTSEFTDLLVPCGHTFCQSCSQKLVNCPNCRVKIDYRLPMKKFNIRIRKESDEKTTKRKKVE
jgi:hypothetical protein